MTGHGRHFDLQDEDPDCLTATVRCDCGWWAGPVVRVAAWKTRLIDLFREHVEELEAAVA